MIKLATTKLLRVIILIDRNSFMLEASKNYRKGNNIKRNGSQ